MWSVGCILAELLWRKPLFRGRNFADQLKVGVLGAGMVTTNSLAHVSLCLLPPPQQIITVLGTPTPDDVSFITNKELLKLLASWKPREKVQ